ncbi:MAG TPA: hypothetical protein VNZ03_14855 [Terriglobales bacterium]|jgi:hypothetical protein|nr:hypothetical protein [Terriglobales bacterium]
MATQQAPQIDFNNAKTQAHQLHDTLISLYSEFATPGWLAEALASSAAGLFFIVAVIVLPVMQIVIAIGSFIAGSFLATIGDAKEEQREDLNNLLAETINEMLGTSLSGQELSAGSGAGADMESNQQIGNAVLGLFESAFGGGGPVSPNQGADNARKFAGFGVNFATTQGFLSILSEAASLGFFKEFHELPDGLMHALGISRLQRLALQPLIQNAIQKPYHKYCMSQYRPTQLAEAQLVKALHSGQMSQGDVSIALAQLGYPDELIAFVLTDFEQKMALSELVLLRNNGDITEQDVINKLTLTGMPEDQAKLQLKAADLAAVKTQQNALLSELETAYIAGHVDQATYNSVLSNLSLSDLEEQAFRAKVGFKQEVPRKSLSFAEVEAAIVEGITDFTYLDQWFTDQGYDQQAQLILSYSVLQKIKGAEDKRKFAQYKAAVLRAAKKPVPPWITAAE